MPRFWFPSSVIESSIQFHCHWLARRDVLLQLISLLVVVSLCFSRKPSYSCMQLGGSVLLLPKLILEGLAQCNCRELLRYIHSQKTQWRCLFGLIPLDLESINCAISGSDNKIRISNLSCMISVIMKAVVVCLCTFYGWTNNWILEAENGNLSHERRWDRWHLAITRSCYRSV